MSRRLIKCRIAPTSSPAGMLRSRNQRAAGTATRIMAVIPTAMKAPSTPLVGISCVAASPDSKLPLQQSLGDAQRLLKPGLVQSSALGKIARAAALAADLGDGLLEDAAHVGRTAGGLSEE